MGGTCSNADTSLEDVGSFNPNLRIGRSKIKLTHGQQQTQRKGQTQTQTHTHNKMNGTATADDDDDHVVDAGELSPAESGSSSSGSGSGSCCPFLSSSGKSALYASVSVSAWHAFPSWCDPHAVMTRQDGDLIRKKLANDAG